MVAMRRDHHPVPSRGCHGCYVVASCQEAGVDSMSALALGILAGYVGLVVWLVYVIGIKNERWRWWWLS